MSGKTDKLSFGRGQIIGNSKCVALCYEFDNTVLLLNDPLLKASTVEISTEYFQLSSGFSPIVDIEIPLKQIINVELQLAAINGEIFINPEPGFIQRLLTQDITIAQMVRLVREKLRKQKI